MDQRGGGGPLRKRRGERLPPVPPPSFQTPGTWSEAAERASTAEWAPSAEDTLVKIRTARIDECLQRAASIPPPPPSDDGETEERVVPTLQDGIVVGPGDAGSDGPVAEAAALEGESGEGNEDSEEAVAIPAEFRRWPRLFSSAEETALTDAERIEAYADVRGLRRPSPFASSPEDRGRLAALRGALEEIPPKEKGAFLAAQAENPLLLETSPHLKLWLGTADFDPDRVARRVARYWERRQAALGRAAFLSGSVAAPSDADFLQLYREWRTDDDPDTWEPANGAIGNYLSDWVRSKVASLNEEIDKMPPNKKMSIAEAWNFNSSGQTDRTLALLFDVQVLFLQSVDFQVSLAARKMAEYSEVKSNLLGPEQRQGDECHHNGNLFASGFTLKTLREEHLTEMELGFTRLLPGFDSAGRVVCFCECERLASGGYSRQRLARFFWYVLHMAIESRSCQDNGIVIISNLGVSPQQIDHKLFGMLIRMTRCLPVVIKAGHECFDVVPWWFQTFVVPLSKWYLGRKLGMRYLVHGGREETLRDFEACGIRVDMLPAVLGGSASSESWNAVLQERMDAGL